MCVKTFFSFIIDDFEKSSSKYRGKTKLTTLNIESFMGLENVLRVVWSPSSTKKRLLVGLKLLY
ncbi:hypothetical protein FC1_15580 [Flavobacterium columnare NBRC 100251 = ATCC 23463]|nr:hypothetical protein FC1_15580 [Flavobacterium columnare NBRC 100251 = ATCC 23463]